MNKPSPITRGTHHIGLTVSKLEASAAFFTDVLGWSEMRREPNYPSIFVTDGLLMITLWATQTHPPRLFDRKENIGLHHLALSVDNLTDLELIHQKLIQHQIKIEFSPELLREGPAKHMMCYEPSGIRVEFICLPK